MGDDPKPAESAELHRHFGLLHATALNVIMIVGAGIFVTIPPILHVLPGPWALLSWFVAGGLILVDSLVWSELAAAIPGSGGSYLYLLECYGSRRWGRLMAFLFVWQFLISGPLEIASGLIAMALFVSGIDPEFADYDTAHTIQWELGTWQDKPLLVAVGPARLLVLGLCVLLLVLLYRRITILGKLTVTFWVGVLGVIAWILVVGAWNFNPDVAFKPLPPGVEPPKGYGVGLGEAMILAIYAYIGYYNVCYISDEVRDPGRTIPRSIQWSALLVCVLFVGLHLALLGTVDWQTIPTESPALDTYSLPGEFMDRIYDHSWWARPLVSLLLIWSCLGSAFAALLGYSRVPYGAARHGHFFAVFARVHPVHRIPHLSLLLVGALTLFWSLFGLESVIFALIVTRILVQFMGQAAGLMLLRKLQPERPRPYRLLLYPLPCLVALAGWAYVYFTSGLGYIILGLSTMATGVLAFFLWSFWTQRWPFVMEPELADGKMP